MSHRHIGGGQVREGAPGTARAFPSVPLLLRTIEHDVETPVDVPCRQHAEMSSTSEDTAAGCKPRPARGSTPPPAAVRPPHSVRIVIVVTQGYGALEVFQSVVVPEESARREAGRGETVPAKVVVEKAVSTRSGTAPPPKHDDAMVSLHPTVEPSGSVVGVGGSAVLPSLNWMSIRLGYLCGVAFCRATRRFRGLKHQKLPPSQPPPVESRPHAPEWSLLCHWGFEVLNERFSPVAFASNFDHHHCFPADAVGGEEPADGDRQTSGRVSTGVQFVSLVGGGACQKLDRPVDECRERTPRCSETVGDEADAGGLTPVPAADARLRSSTPDAALIRRRADRDEQHDALTDTAVESVEGRVFDVDRPRDAKSHPTPVDHEVPSTSRITTISTESEPPLHQSSSMVYTTSASLDESTAIAGTTKGATVRDKYAVVTDDAKDSNRPVEDDDQHTPREQTVRVTPSDEDGSGGAAQLLLTEQTSIDFHCSTDRAPLDASGQRRADELQEDDTVTFFCEDANTSGGSVLRPPVGDDSKKHQRGASDLPPPADSSSSTTAEAAGGQKSGALTTLHDTVDRKGPPAARALRDASPAVADPAAQRSVGAAGGGTHLPRGLSPSASGTHLRTEARAQSPFRLAAMALRESERRAAETGRPGGRPRRMSVERKLPEASTSASGKALPPPRSTASEAIADRGDCRRAASPTIVVFKDETAQRLFIEGDLRHIRLESARRRAEVEQRAADDRAMLRASEVAKVTRVETLRDTSPHKAIATIVKGLQPNANLNDKIALLPAFPRRVTPQRVQELTERLYRSARHGKEFYDLAARMNHAEVSDCTFSPKINDNAAPSRQCHTAPQAVSCIVQNAATPREKTIRSRPPSPAELPCVALYQLAESKDRSAEVRRQQIRHDEIERIVAAKKREDHHFAARCARDERVEAAFRDTLVGTMRREEEAAKLPKAAQSFACDKALKTGRRRFW